MSDSSTWTVHLGRWWRVPIRVHAVFIVVAIFALFLATSGPESDGFGLGVLAVALLFATALVHELGHAFAALRAGANPDQIVVGPMGGLAAGEAPRDPQSEMFKALGGPLVNLGLLLVLLPLVVACGSWSTLAGLLSPVEPANLTDGPWWLAALKLAFWMNWLMLVVNLLPAFPFDGARVLRSLLWPAMEYRGASHVAVRASKLVALGICILAWLLRDLKSAEILPAWVPLVLLATFIYFHAQHEAARLEEAEWDDELFSYDFSQGYTSLERSSDVPRRAGSFLRRWLENRRELRRQRQLTQERDEERQVDAILIRLHEAGMDGLSSKQRALLHRVSARYRNR